MRSSLGGARSNIHRPKIELFPLPAKHVKRNLITNALSLFAAMAALMCAVITALSADNNSNVTQTDPLPSWNDGSAEQATVDFARSGHRLGQLEVYAARGTHRYIRSGRHAKSGIPVTALVAVTLGII